MTRTAGIVGWLAAAAVGAALGGPAPPAAARRPDPPEPTTGTIVRTVEVPVPVPIHDWATEAVQMSVAASLGATVGAVLAGRATALRLRRRSPPGTGLIDITDVVQPGPVPAKSAPVSRTSGRRSPGLSGPIPPG
jgi:hypothetical protein